MQRAGSFGKKDTKKIAVRKTNSLPPKFSLGDPTEWGDAWLKYRFTEYRELSWCQLHWTWWCQLHRKGSGIILAKISSVAAPEAIKITNFSVASDEDLVIITTFSTQCLSSLIVASDEKVGIITILNSLFSLSLLLYQCPMACFLHVYTYTYVFFSDANVSVRYPECHRR